MSEAVGLPEGVELSIIVAVSENGVIGHDGGMPWRLSSDLKRFKQLTLGHTIVMGRKTWDSIGRLLPGRTTVILTRQPDFEVPGAIIVGSLQDAIGATDDPEPFVVGGAEIYRLALPFSSKLYLTRVAAEIEGDTFFPEFDTQQWSLISEEAVPQGEKDSHRTLFQTYARV